MTLTEAIALADAVARDGLEPHRAQIPAVIHLARDHGVRDPLVDALDDPEGPTVARIRALGRIVLLLASSNRSPSDAIDRATRPTHCRLTRETLSDRSPEEQRCIRSLPNRSPKTSRESGWRIHRSAPSA